MNLTFAQKCADRLVSWLAPISERVEIAGSIRRKRPECADVDLVVIPKIEFQKDMFGEIVAQRNATQVAIAERVDADHWTVLRAGPDILSFSAKGVQVDVFWAEPKTWGTRLLCRTGSSLHNIWLCQAAVAMGGKWHPFAGLYLGHMIYGETEEQIYGALGMRVLDPVTERSTAHLRSPREFSNRR